jgi:ferredoxin-NADP reductase
MPLLATVARKTRLADNVVALTLTADALPPWEPGAHVDLHLPCGLTRQFSLCGDPGDPSAWRVAVLREPAGRGGSACVHDALAEGDELEVRGPRNNFPLVEAGSYLFIAGGIGITPILPMLTAAKAPWRLFYGGRSRGSMAFADELPPGDVTLWPQDERGPLDLDAILAGTGPNTVVYCCGPEPLLAAVEARRPDVHLERFRAHAEPAAGESFEIELASSGRVLEVPRGNTILQTLRGAGLQVLTSCEEGTCGTCETGVLDGVPDHRDTVLTSAEADAGDIMMICVSRARTPRLVLDL